MRFTLKLLGASVLLAMGVSTAQAQIYKITLSGANEIPAVTTPGSGTAVLTINTSTHQMRLRTSFANLLGNTSASHIHCCVVQPANAGVATTTPSFVGFPLGVTSGSSDNTYDMTLASTWNAAFVTANGGTVAGAEAAFLAGIAAGNRSYLNIHSVSFPGGEIRGAPVLFSFVPAASPQAANLAAALDSLGAGSGALTDKLINLASMTPSNQTAALERLLPTASYASNMLTFGNMTTTFDQLGARLQGLRRETGSQAPVTTTSAGGFWVKAIGLEGEQDAQDGFAGFESDGWDLAAGIEAQLIEGFTVGAAFNHSDNSLDYLDQLSGNTSDITSNQLSVYAAHTQGNGYVEGVVAYAMHDFEDTRDTGVAGNAITDREGDMWGARIGAGFSTELAASLSLTPQIRVDWASSEQDAYIETGDAALALSVGDQSADRVRSSIGAQLDMATAMGNTSARPFVRAFWNHDFNNDGENQTARFVGGGITFVTKGQEFESDSYTLGLGINFYSQGNFSAAISYDATIQDDYESQVAQAKVFWAF